MADDKNKNAEVEEEQEADVITLEFDDDSKLDCEIMGVFEYDNKEFIALIPDDDSDDVYIYGYEEYEDGTFELLDIADDDLFKKVAQEFENIMANPEEE
jgi:hypothetical protein